MPRGWAPLTLAASAVLALFYPHAFPVKTAFCKLLGGASDPFFAVLAYKERGGWPRRWDRAAVRTVGVFLTVTERGPASEKRPTTNSARYFLKAGSFLSIAPASQSSVTGR